MSRRPKVGPVITKRQTYPPGYGHPLSYESPMQKLGLLVPPWLARIVLQMLGGSTEDNNARKFAEKKTETRLKTRELKGDCEANALI